MISGTKEPVWTEVDVKTDIETRTVDTDNSRGCPICQGTGSAINAPMGEFHPQTEACRIPYVPATERYRKIMRVITRTFTFMIHGEEHRFTKVKTELLKRQIWQLKTEWVEA